MLYCFGFTQMLMYFAAFEVFFEENLPKLFAHFKSNNLTPDIYLIDWYVSPFSESRCISANNDDIM